MSLRTLLLLALAALLGGAVAAPVALAAAPPEVKLEVNENCVEADWPCWSLAGSGAKPSPATKITVAAGGEVRFTDNAGTPATVSWTGPAPTCSGIPASAMTKWAGMCKFEQPGTFKFESPTLFNGGASLDYTKYAVVVESAVAGTTPTTTPASPLEGGGGALKIAASQRGSKVHGSLDVSQAGSGGLLDVALLASKASLSGGHGAGQVSVGRLVSSLSPGRMSFSVPLSARGRKALGAHRRLRLTVKITLTGPQASATTVTRVVMLHS